MQGAPAVVAQGDALAYIVARAVVAGKPSVTVGSDLPGYIVIRDPSNAVWMGRHNGITFDGWQRGSGTFATDPQVAVAGGNVYVVTLSASGGVWYNTFVQGMGKNWTSSVNTGGTLSSGAAASTGPQLVLTGRDEC